MKIGGRDAFLKLHWDPPRASHGAIKIAAYSARDTFLSGEVKRASYWTEVGILHYVKWNDLVQVNSPQIIALTCHKCPSMCFNGRHNISSEMLMQYFTYCTSPERNVSRAEYAVIFIAPWLARSGSQCNLRNASLPAIFIGLGNYGRNYFVPPTDALASTDMNTFATHLPPRRVAKLPAKKPTAETCRSRFKQL